MKDDINAILIDNLRAKLALLEQVHADTRAAEKPLERVRRQLREAQAKRLGELLTYDPETTDESQGT